MNESEHRTRTPLPWAIIVGLAATSLLWPLLELTRIPVEGIGRVGAVLAATVAIWITVAGFGRIRRPILSLTIAGALYGVLVIAVGALVPGAGGPSGLAPILVALVVEAPRGAAIGALCGLAAAGVQRAFGRRETAGTPSDADRRADRR